MAEQNGSGRLDRLEALMADMIEHHEREFKSLLTWQVLMQDKMDKWAEYIKAEERMRSAGDDALRQNAKALDERVDKLVTAIGQLVSRMGDTR